VSVSQDIIYRRAKYEREDHLMHVYNKFQGLIQLTKNDKKKEMFSKKLYHQTGFHATGLSLGG